MGLSGLIRIGFEATLIGMLLAAVRRTTGVIFAYEQYNLARYIYGFLGYGEYCYSRLLSYCKTSSYFRKELKDYDGKIEEIDEDDKRDKGSSDSYRRMFPKF